MSKSRGNVISPALLLDRYGPDATRYFLLRSGQYEGDAEFSEPLAAKMYKAELMSQLGNLCKRATAPTLNPGQVIHVPLGRPLRLPAEDEPLIRDLATLAADVTRGMREGYDVAGGIERVFATIALANRWWDACQPWRLPQAAAAGADARLQEVLFLARECMRIVAILLQPVMPGKMCLILDALAVGSGERTLAHAVPHPALAVGTAVTSGGASPPEASLIHLQPMPILFPKLTSI